MIDDQHKPRRLMKRFEAFLLKHRLGDETHDARFKKVVLTVVALPAHKDQQELDEDQNRLFNEATAMPIGAFDDYVAG
jgi:hypothetical protein